MEKAAAGASPDQMLSWAAGQGTFHNQTLLYVWNSRQRVSSGPEGKELTCKYLHCNHSKLSIANSAAVWLRKRFSFKALVHCVVDSPGEGPWSEETCWGWLLADQTLGNSSVSKQLSRWSQWVRTDGQSSKKLIWVTACLRFFSRKKTKENSTGREFVKLDWS